MATAISIGKHDSLPVTVTSAKMFRGSFTYNITEQSLVLGCSIGIGTLLTSPEGLEQSFENMRKYSEGGGCWFCESSHDEIELKEFIVYAIEVEYIDTIDQYNNQRCATKCICENCFISLKEKLSDSTTSDVASKIL